ncbi:SDR family NAD(P)-dependent oxidoreductase [Xanthomonas citri]|uniref:SDR family NAD(P)-dependent oxidoreductase n=1 Tax=Xanthomonas citri TaxID=346 RepID=UPI000B1F9BF8|nr:SDR family NAD(P)-dependent oxidoreductase [Xanthomonas citri]
MATPTAFAAHPDEPSACAVACFRTLKALFHRGLGDDALEFTLVTTGACAVDADAPVDAAQAATHGLVGSLAKEYAHWTVRIVDIVADDPRPFDDMLDRPVDGHGRTSAHRDGEWLTQELIACEVEARDNAYREGGVYVIVGAAGGIGEALSEHLIRRYRAHVVWLGRRAHDAGIAARIDRLVALGGPAPIYIQADATRRGDLERAYREIRERHDEIHGIVHSAIVLLDKGLANMDEERFLAGIGAKVDASVRLAEVFADEPLDFAVFFSSFQSFARAGGQGNYASGCTFQDAMAHELSRTWPCRVRVMNWGYWGSVGVVASEDIQRRMADLGVASIEPEEGLAALDRLLGGPFTQLAFVKTHRDAVANDEPPPQLVALPDDTPSIDMGMLFS